MSSSAVAIDIDGLSKRYTIGLADRPTQFRESIASMFSAPWKRLHQLGGGTRAATDFWALRDISFDVRMGDVVGIIGPNGAGKSTLLKVLSRITPPTSGHIDLDGRVSIHYGPHRVAEYAIDQLPVAAPRRRGTPRPPKGRAA